MQHHDTPYSVELDTLEKYYRTNLKQGLSYQEVRQRIAEIGPNGLPKKKPPGYLFNFFSQFKNPLIYLLFVASGLMLFIGQVTDCLVILGVVVINALMGVIQEGRAERSLTSLRNLETLEVLVIRGGEEKQIEARELVPGDIVHLTAGNAVPADARIIEALHLQVVEAALTGESQAIHKIDMTIDQATILAERKNMLYTGTYIVAGRCLALITSTATHTELGKIARITEEAPLHKTPIEKKIARFGQVLSIVAGGIFFLLLGVGYLRGLPFADIFMVAISQVVSLIPEGLPAAITIALAVGVQRMAAQKAIVRRLVAVETLGSTTAICTDKTGTLTRGEMLASEVFLPGQNLIQVQGIGYAPQGSFMQSGKVVDPYDNNALLVLLEAGVLCNDARLQQEGGVWHVIGDPTEGALLTLAKKAEFDEVAIRQEHPRLREIPFDSKAKMMATNCEGVVMIKGAIEAVLALCPRALIDDEEVVLTEKLLLDIEHEAERLALEGRRILGFARMEGGFNEKEEWSQLKGKSLFLGFVAQMDPPRPEAAQAVTTCQAAGIRPIMVTGDHLLTAKAIARQLGLLHDGQQGIDGAQLDLLSDEQLKQQIGTIAVFARLHPEQKLRIIKALQSCEEVVAMTGDGVNDAPALAKADVGIAMGITGTDVAKQAAKVVITDDNFATIVKAVEQGRLAYYNIKKVILYLLTTNCAAAMTVLIAVVAGFPLPMEAMQILWINVVTEGTVTINLILDPLEGDEMQRPPVKKNDQILCGNSFLRFMYLTPTVTALLLGYFIYHWKRDVPLIQLQTQIFTLLAFCAWFKVLSARSESKSCLTLNILKNGYLSIGLVASVLLQAAVIYVPQLNEVFHTTPLSARQVIVLMGIGSVVMWIEELRKWIFRK
ncbi:MAG: HAD-IC family P-type ATPase [Simkania sp.]|nr:HAD-IC family P-type ATPase [Simkania sp.]